MIPYVRHCWIVSKWLYETRNMYKMLTGRGAFAFQHNVYVLGQDQIRVEVLHCMGHLYPRSYHQGVTFWTCSFVFVSRSPDIGCACLLRQGELTVRVTQPTFVCAFCGRILAQYTTLVVAELLFTVVGSWQQYWWWSGIKGRSSRRPLLQTHCFEFLDVLLFQWSICQAEAEKANIRDL